jgi:hypothetical protein
MTITDDGTYLVRELGNGLGSLTFRDNGKSRIYRHEPSDDKARRLTAVSTILAVLDKPALVRWAEDHGARGALAAVRMGELDPAIHQDDEAISVVRALSLGADAAKKQAATRGLSIHDALESWCISGDMPNPTAMREDERPYLQGLARALLALNPEPIRVEQITCHLDLGYAGRYDLLADINGQRVLVDLKTSKRGRGYPEAHVQLAAYDLAEQSLGSDPADRHIVLAVGPDGSYCADEGVATTGDWLSVLECFRSISRVRSHVDGLIRADKKAREAA